MIRSFAAAVAVLACAGCSQLAVETTSFSVSAATGPTLNGSGYSVNVPMGWGPSKQRIAGFEADAIAFNLRDKDSFADNLNVVLHPGGAATPQEAEESAERDLASDAIAYITVNDRVRVAEGESAHVTAAATLIGNDYMIEQFYPTDDDQTYIVTFSFSTTLTAEERARVTDATLVSWDWTD